METREKGYDILSKILDKLGEDVEIEIKEEDETITFDIKGPDLGLIIGKQGQTLDAIQAVLGAIINRMGIAGKQIVVDAEGYRQRQRKIVEELALRAAEKAMREDEPVTLRPMSSFERKLVHIVLRDNQNIETLSDGREPYRRVTIFPKNK